MTKLLEKLGSLFNKGADTTSTSVQLSPQTTTSGETRISLASTKLNKFLRSTGVCIQSAFSSVSQPVRNGFNSTVDLANKHRYVAGAIVIGGVAVIALGGAMYVYGAQETLAFGRGLVTPYLPESSFAGLTWGESAQKLSAFASGTWDAATTYASGAAASLCKAVAPAAEAAQCPPCIEGIARVFHSLEAIPRALYDTCDAAMAIAECPAVMALVNNRLVSNVTPDLLRQLPSQIVTIL